MKNNNKKRKIDFVLIFALLLFVAGVILLLIDPIKNKLRQNKVEEVVNAVESQIYLDETQITFVVNTNDFVVNGEEYDVFSDEEQEDDSEAIAFQESIMQEQINNLPDEVVLTAIGMLDVESVNMHLPIWDEASIVSLRYGAGHFEGSVMPGESGNCSILGHHMRAYGSLFNRLKEISIGDTARITTQGGVEYNYYIDNIITIEANNLNDYLGGNITDTRQLTLITCAYDGTGRGLRLLVIGHIYEE